MHYKNGREAKVGDKVVGIINGVPKAGIVAQTLPASDACNIAIVPLPEYLSCSWQSKDFLHADDIAACAAGIGDSSLP